MGAVTNNTSASPPSALEITRLLTASLSGSTDAKERLLPFVYADLRRAARRALSRERPGHTLQPTALVHEAYLRLVDQTRATPQNRAHFVAMAAQMMRRILINHALAKKADKRGGLHTHIPIEDAPEIAAESPGVDVVMLDSALKELAAIDARQAEIVELRYFGGLSVEEVAALLDISPATVKRKWATAKLWLRRRIEER
jgi:RNA polymerase sigma-70 factor (ECF subfamily)